jgi:Zn-dependent protease
VTAVLFNLIPVPPLDGYGVIAPLLPRDTQKQIEAVSSQVFWILLLILWFSPSVNLALWKGIFAILQAVGVPPELAFDGYNLFKFWSTPAFKT